jgi:hypothetical protein
MSPFNSMCKAPSKSPESKHVQVAALDALAWEEPLDIYIDVPPLDICIDDANEVASDGKSVAECSDTSTLMSLPTPTRSRVSIPVTTEAPFELPASPVSTEIVSESHGNRGQDILITPSIGSLSISPTDTAFSVLSTLTFAEKERNLPVVSVAMSPPASTLASPRDSEFGVADWQLGMEAMLDTRASQKSQLDSAQHVANLQAEVDLWKERAVQMLCSSKMDTKAARRSLVFVWRVFTAWHRQAASSSKQAAGVYDRADAMRRRSSA